MLRDGMRASVREQEMRNEELRSTVCGKEIKL